MAEATKFHMELVADREIAETYWKCPICLDLLSDAVETKCGHLFCADCIRKTPISPCPSCRQNIPVVVHPALTIRRQIAGLRCKCPNLKCAWVGCCGDLRGHLKSSCEHELHECCGEKRYAASHAEHLRQHAICAVAQEREMKLQQDELENAWRHRLVIHHINRGNIQKAHQEIVEMCKYRNDPGAAYLAVITGIEPDGEKLDYLEFAARGGIPGAMYLLACEYVKQETETLIRTTRPTDLLFESARLGYLPSHHVIGIYFFQGHYLQRDVGAALMHMLYAADRGYPHSMNWLIRMLENYPDDVARVVSREKRDNELARLRQMKAIARQSRDSSRSGL